jgi:hypothetical protein
VQFSYTKVSSQEYLYSNSAAVAIIALEADLVTKVQLPFVMMADLIARSSWFYVNCEMRDGAMA